MRCEIIAEIGYNHCGDIALAKDMICAAKECGADFVKFQTWSVKNLKNGPWDIRRNVYKQSELTPDHHYELFEFCNCSNIQFMTSVYNYNDLYKLPQEYISYIKIPSPELTNYKLLDACKKRFEHLIISTGSSTMSEVKDVYNYVSRFTSYSNVPPKECTLLHCVSSYPCSAENANLKRIDILKKICDLVGYSDHTVGVTAPAYALSHGCRFIEKHFTTDQSLPGRDNAFAATPSILKQICEMRNELSLMLVDRGSKFQECEKDVREIYRGRWSKETEGECHV